MRRQIEVLALSFRRQAVRNLVRPRYDSDPTFPPLERLPYIVASVFKLLEALRVKAAAMPTRSPTVSHNETATYDLLDELYGG